MELLQQSFSHESLLLQDVLSCSSQDEEEEEIDHFSSSLIDTTNMGRTSALRRKDRRTSNRMSIRQRQEENIVTRGDHNNNTTKNQSAWKQAYTSIRETRRIQNNYNHRHSSSSNFHNNSMNSTTNINPNFHSSKSFLHKTTRTLHSSIAHHCTNNPQNELPNQDDVFPRGVKTTQGLHQALEGLGKCCAKADQAQRMGRKGKSSELIMEKAANIKGFLKLF